MAPLGTVPPTLGAWWVYQRFSILLTMVAPPFSRAHSANRALIELP
ncbi:MAG: hypothetical protein ACLP2J_09510 [Acidimicrobiales bacterium]